MNKNRWRNPRISPFVLALKLSEEAAEVGRVLTDSDNFGDFKEADLTKHALDHLMLELNQVIFIAEVMLSRAKQARVEKN